MNSNASPKNHVGTKTMRLVTAALFAALSLAVKPFEIYLLPVARLNFVAVPIIMTGIILGPIWGGAVGFIADMLGYLLMDKTGAAINPILTFSSIMLGVIPGLVFLKQKTKEIRKAKYTLYNIISYILLLVCALVLLLSEGSLKIDNGIMYILSPSSGQFSVVSWWIVGIIAVAFIAYSVAVIAMLGKKRSDGLAAEQDNPKILFAITISIILADIIVSGLGLGMQYGWPLSLMLIVRILKGFVTIPIFTFICFILYRVIKKLRLNI